MRILMILAISLVLGNCYADSWDVVGSQRFGGETLNSVEKNGSVIMKGTKVEGDVRVNGTLEAGGTILNQVYVNGFATLRESEVKGVLAVNGSLYVTKSRLNDVEVVAREIKIRESEVKNITVRALKSFKGVQVIDLTGGTKVSGKIVVESGKGEVWISSGSLFDKSFLQGAEIIVK